MATPRKRKNAADHGSMKINNFFKPIKNTVVHVPSENNDENLPPQGQPVEKKRAFGQQSLSKVKPVKSPLKDRNPEVRICTSNSNQSSRATFSVLRDDDIKKGVAKAPQPEQKELKVIQLSQPSSQTLSNQSSQSSQSNNSQKDDLITKIKPKRLFTVFNDEQEGEEDKGDKQSQSGQTSHSRKQNISLKHNHLADFIDDLFDQDSQSSQTSISQQENYIPKQKHFSIFRDIQEDEQSQFTQASHSQQEEDSVSKRKPFSIFIDAENDEQSHVTSYPQDETVQRKPMFPVYIDNQEDDEHNHNRHANHSQQENIDSKSNSRKQFNVYNDSEENKQNRPSQTEKIQQEEIAAVSKTKPKKLFSVFVDDCENENSRDDVAGFGVFRDEDEDDVHESITMKQSESRVLRDKTKEIASENNYSASNGFFDDDDDDENEEELAQLLTITTKQTYQGLREEKSQGSTVFIDFFSDDQDSDTYSEIIPLHDNEFSTACEPSDAISTTITTTDSKKMTSPYKVNANSSDLSSSESDSKDTNDTTPPVRSNIPSETNQSRVSLEARTLSPTFYDPVEEIYTPYPNPQGDSLSEKLGLTKNEA